MQCAGAVAVRGLAPGDPVRVPAGAHPAVPVPVPTHHVEDAALRVPTLN